ncbi:MAG: hypothetical protein A2X36_04535 [Elusimicrobia bacterium GWA2_69_24]|nr:MAG: hypothetical protein A2X36_04535 [Elusimicrobia bacterium GWA2_69_24]HBL16361.1 hypothetical protein [Elusimicrobiota bacterium]
MGAWVLVLLCAQAAFASDKPLSRRVHDKKPWRTLEANSEQRQPVYLGLTPYQLAAKVPPPAAAELPDSLRVLGEAQARRIVASLRRQELELECWPARDDDGALTWAFARWRRSPESDWAWIPHTTPMEDLPPVPFLPKPLKSWEPPDRTAIFSDFSELEGLYDKPVFGDCVWTEESGRPVLPSWLSTRDRDTYLRKLISDEHRICFVLPQPAVLNGRPRSFVTGVSSSAVRWPEELRWTRAGPSHPPSPAVPRLTAWPGDFAAALRRDTLALAGEEELVFPKDGRRLRLTRKNSAQPDHQLSDLSEYLIQRYAALGIAVKVRSFRWRGIPQTNLIAVLPGTLQGRANRPVLLADHVDTAFAEDLFKAGRRRVSVPGADDNAAATAALLQAARILKDVPRRSDIWLVHLTGEEFPADDLGARRLTRELLAERQALRGIVLLDMIGYRDPGDPVFQINAGESPESLRIARVAVDLAGKLALPLSARLRTRFDPESYLYNTDGLIFSDAGFPVVLFNEHLNARHNLERPHYHESTDVGARMDFDYAAGIAQLAIETVAALANEE